MQGQSARNRAAPTNPFLRPAAQGPATVQQQARPDSTEDDPRGPAGTAPAGPLYARVAASWQQAGSSSHVSGAATAAHKGRGPVSQRDVRARPFAARCYQRIPSASSSARRSALSLSARRRALSTKRPAAISVTIPSGTPPPGGGLDSLTENPGCGAREAP